VVESPTVDFEGGGGILPREYFDECLEQPPVLRRKARIIPLPPASPCSGVELPSLEPVSSGSLETEDLVYDDFTNEHYSGKGSGSFDFESEVPLSALWDSEDGDEDVPFMRGLFGMFWDVGSSSSSCSSFSSSSSSCSSSSSDSSSSSKDDDHGFPDSDSDSGYATNSNGSPLEFIDLGAWCRGYSIASPAARSLLFCVDHDSVDLGAPAHSLVEDDNDDSEPSALASLSTDLTCALPRELREAVREGVKVECNRDGSLGVIIGKKKRTLTPPGTQRKRYGISDLDEGLRCLR
jgi:hypothetical protein